MNFGKILDKWEKSDKNKVYPQYDEPEKTGNIPGQKRSRLLKKQPDAEIDLHGMNSDEAWTALENFFTLSKNAGYEKLLIIHGKGNHQNSSSVIREVARRFIERCPIAGESGYSHTREGGSGATWVILKNRN